MMDELGMEVVRCDIDKCRCIFSPRTDWVGRQCAEDVMKFIFKKIKNMLPDKLRLSCFCQAERALGYHHAREVGS